ncbi:MAG: mitochondrial fission ELM1 family protein [Methylobacteriaceae bacterium]|nr:mitochondrial fission ELM1 family protein [Methylobacteriaceae bacterium]
MPPSTTTWVVTDGKIGDEVHCFGVAQALGAAAERRLIAPRLPWAAVAPFGPIDPRERADEPGSPVAPPFPDILIASGRRTVPYLRHVKRASGRRTFTVFLKDPRTGPRTADAIWVPEHDPLRGANVVVTLTSPHSLTPDVIARARAEPDRRIAWVNRPRLGIVLGGPSGHHRFKRHDARRLGAIALECARQGFGVMVTPSRRTPAAFLEAVRAPLADAGLLGNCAYVWDGAGENAYLPILANADRILVTGDSVNMLGEATATGAPVYVFVPSGMAYHKMVAFIDRLAERGAVRRYAGSLDPFTYEPIDATPEIARLVAARYLAFRG